MASNLKLLKTSSTSKLIRSRQTHFLNTCTYSFLQMCMGFFNKRPATLRLSNLKYLVIGILLVWILMLLIPMVMRHFRSHSHITQTIAYFLFYYIYTLYIIAVVLHGM